MQASSLKHREIEDDSSSEDPAITTARIANMGPELTPSDAEVAGGSFDRTPSPDTETDGEDQKPFPETKVPDEAQSDDEMYFIHGFGQVFAAQAKVIDEQLESDAQRPLGAANGKYMQQCKFWKTCRHAGK